MRLRDLPERSTWVFTGDSITQGVFHTHGARSWVELVHERVRWELDRLSDIVVNSGVSGWTAAQVRGEFDHLVGRFDPAVVSMSFGTNDALDGAAGLPVFRRELTALIQTSAALGARVVLHTPVPVMPDAPAARRENLPAYAEVVRELAVAKNVTLVDHERHWLAHYGTAAPTAWMDDHTHPNAVGHREMANTTLRVLGLGTLDEG
ncbi:SGNH/GDSL hydrolase family protein [Flexivirga meconopsidis]|uniref:SGNH/GDSL hydrolase family protein n=1 Tax=Flexivirga meconopsidis TaxID=2977121 RepID=UPI00223FBD54|nr:SGNH/GDSL hydrolase family protein [Flexivirga meconopsidis]